MQFEREQPGVPAEPTPEHIEEQKKVPESAVEKAGITDEMLDALYDNHDEKDWWKK